MLTCRTRASCRDRQKEIWGSWGSSDCALQSKNKSMWSLHQSDICQSSHIWPFAKFTLWN